MTKMQKEIQKLNREIAEATQKEKIMRDEWREGHEARKQKVELVKHILASGAEMKNIYVPGEPYYPWEELHALQDQIFRLESKRDRVQRRLELFGDPEAKAVPPTYADMLFTCAGLNCCAIFISMVIGLCQYWPMENGWGDRIVALIGVMMVLGLFSFPGMLTVIALEEIRNRFDWCLLAYATANCIFCYDLRHLPERLKQLKWHDRLLLAACLAIVVAIIAVGIMSGENFILTLPLNFILSVITLMFVGVRLVIDLAHARYQLRKVF